MQVDITPYLDNTAPISRFRELGVLRFAKDFYPEVFNNDFAELHYELATNFLELYNPNRMTREDRKAYGVVHREAAKTTLVNFLLPLYVIYTKNYPWFTRWLDGTFGEVVNKEKFIVIVSETGASAERFTNNIRSAISRRGDMAQIFGEKSPKELHIDEETRRGERVWRKTAFVTTDDTIVYGAGLGMQVRGINVNNTRPTLLIIDDLYSRKTVTTEQSREKIGRFFDEELLNTLDSPSGKLYFLGTILNRDTHIYKVTKDNAWYGLQKPIIEYSELSTVLKQVKTDEKGVIVVPPYDKCMQIQKTLKTLSWADRHTLYFILQLYQRAQKKNDLTMFFQEYLNITQNPGDEAFAERHFAFVDIEFINKECHFEYAGYKWRCYPKWSVAIDIASSHNVKSDDSVIIASAHVQAMTIPPGTNQPRYKTFALTGHVEGGKYEIDSDTVPSYVTSLVKLNKKLAIKNVSMEINGQQETIYRTTKDILRRKHNLYIPLTSVLHSNQMNKTERISASIKSWKNLHNLMVLPNTPEAQIVKDQILFLGETSKDDYADAFAESVVNECITHQKYMKPPQPREKRSRYEEKPHYDWETR